MPRKKDPLQKHIDDLSEELAEMREEVMERADYVEFGPKEVASFHGIIGGKNNTYVDAVREVFLSPQQFVAEWTEGALEEARSHDDQERRTYGRAYQNHAVHRVLRFLQDDLIERYVEMFLERNFYRQYHARTRSKPEDALWELWFGAKHQEYGLFISPRYDDGWENDVSEIRRATFDYWTIEHVLTSGFVVPGKTKVHKIIDMNHLFDMYHDVFVRATGSQHSAAFAKEYESFVRGQKRPEVIPFMIPEFRYEGAAVDHKHRLDFTILSASHGRKIGIELSPWSTHGRVTRKKKLVASGGESAVEKKRIEKWEADTRKRNAYFQTYGITTITFTDSDLADIESAFESVTQYLLEPKKKRRAAPDVKSQIARYRFG
jgi:hypothetical protein